jgi:hypothetical protein
VIDLGTGSTIRNCGLKAVDIRSIRSGTTIADNTFENTSPYITTIDLSSDMASAATGFSITGNTDISRIQIETGAGTFAGPSAGTISGNTITPVLALGNGFAIDIVGGPTSTPAGIDITGNQINNRAYWSEFSGNLAVINVDASSGIHFNDNVIKSDNPPSCDDCGTIEVGDGTDISFTGNFISELSGSNADQRALRYRPNGSVTGTVDHNTFTCTADSHTCVLLDLSPANTTASLDLTVNYNIFTSFIPSPTGQGIRDSQFPGATVIMDNDYNGFWNLNAALDAPGTGIE